MLVPAEVVSRSQWGRQAVGIGVLVLVAGCSGDGSPGVGGRRGQPRRASWRPSRRNLRQAQGLALAVEAIEAEAGHDANDYEAMGRSLARASQA